MSTERDNLDMHESDEQTSRLSAWMDALMNEGERLAFEEEMATDPSLKAQAHSFKTAIDTLRQMPTLDAPKDFLEAVQSRIRRRTRGRFFGYSTKVRFPYEAIFSVILIGLMSTLYLLADPPSLNAPTPAEPAVLEAPMSPNQVALLSSFGTLSRQGAYYALQVKNSLLEKLRDALAAQPSLRIIREVPGTQPGNTRVLLGIEPLP